MGCHHRSYWRGSLDWGAYYGAKLGADTTLEAQQREFQAERQKQTRELCLEISGEIDKTAEILFAKAKPGSRKQKTSELSKVSARWSGFSRKAAFNAPAAIYEAVDNVSGVVHAVAYFGQSGRMTVQGQHLGASVTRGEFEDLTADLVNACRTEQGEEPLPTPR